MKGILMTPDNHRAIRDGRKTVTRRLDGLKEINQEPGKWIAVRQDQMVGIPLDTFIFHNKETSEPEYIKPRYQVGETVYIKEAYTFYYCLGGQANIRYKLDKEVVWVEKPSDKPMPKKGYHSPLMMPAWTARDFIQITDVRGERVQEITEDDAIAEGIQRSEKTGRFLPMNCDYATWAFQFLWDSINPKYPWGSNSWNWRYEFKRIEV